MSLPPHRFTLRVMAGASKPVRLYARKHSFGAGDPVSFDVEHGEVTALEYLLGAVGADLAGGIRVLGRKRRIEVDDVEVLVSAELEDPLAYLRVVDHEQRYAGLSRIDLKVYVASFADAEDVRSLWNEVLQACPVISTIRRSVPLNISFQQES